MHLRGVSILTVHCQLTDTIVQKLQYLVEWQVGRYPWKCPVARFWMVAECCRCWPVQHDLKRKGGNATWEGFRPYWSKAPILASRR